jgi:16S rRNA (guanine966-N2)-methyltransferase
LRIVSGKYKGRRITVPKSFKARPTTDFAKENLFNVLNNYIHFKEKIALDLFSGTGSISYELVSRGCPKVHAVEHNFRMYRAIKENAALLGISELQVFRADAFGFIKHIGQSYDFVFADPPYELKNIDTLPGLIFEHKLLKTEGLFILEHSGKYNFTSHAFFVEKREYGSVNFSIFRQE